MLVKKTSLMAALIVLAVVLASSLAACTTAPEPTPPPAPPPPPPVVTPPPAPPPPAPPPAPLEVRLVSPAGISYTNASVNVSVSVTGGVADSVQLLKDSAPLETIPASLTYTWNTTGVPEGLHELKARAWRGATSFESQTVVVSVDRTPPILIQDSRKPPTGGSATASATISVSFNEAVALPSLKDLVLKKNGVALARTVSLSGDARTLTITPAEPLAGTGAMEVVVGAFTDLAGNPPGSSLGTAAGWSWKLSN